MNNVKENEDMLEGERAFSEGYTFLPFIKDDDVKEFRDTISKFAHNYGDAESYLSLLNGISKHEYDARSEMLFRIEGMALQCFPLAIRRLTDKISKRSIRKIIKKIHSPEKADSIIADLDEIYSHYDFFVTKGVAHQDEFSIKTVYDRFPNSDIIDKDMKYLLDLYYSIVKGICRTYIKIQDEQFDFSPDIKKLLN